MLAVVHLEQMACCFEILVIISFKLTSFNMFKIIVMNELEFPVITNLYMDFEIHQLCIMIYEICASF